MAAIQVRVKELRQLKGWSQAELARQSGVGQSTISGIEAGNTDGVSLGIVEKLARALGCDPAYLITERRES